MAIYIVMVLASTLAGCVQAVTGFGGGIMLMQFLPYYLPMNVAPAVSQGVCTPLNFMISWRYRKDIIFRQVIIPTIFYMLFSTIAIWVSGFVNLGRLKLVFGIFLIVLSIYFIFFQKRLRVSGNIWTAMICSSISGILSGFFGIGGPTMAMYYLAVTETKEEYLGTMNMTFAIVMVYQIIVRIVAGTLTVSMIPLLIAGVLGVMCGRFIGGKIVDKIDGDKLRKIVYIFLAISGVITTINSL